MQAKSTNDGPSKFCAACGTALVDGARFCHACGVEAGMAARSAGRAAMLPWAATGATVVILLVLVAMQAARPDAPADGMGAPVGGMPFAPDLSTMSPDEQADRLFNRVMRLSSEGKMDSAAFFAPMALGALQALAPFDAHRRYDLGLVSLVSGATVAAQAQADSILAQRRNHLLGLALAIRVAEARGNTQQVTALRRRLVSAEATERAAALPEYEAHDADIRAAVSAAGGR